MRSTFTRRAFAAVAAVATSAALATPVAGAQSSFMIGTPPTCEATPAEFERVITEVHEATNRERVEAGRDPVQRLDSLDGIAQDWSDQMASEDRMYHNPNIRAQVADTYPGNWAGYGENVLQNWCGVNGERLVQQWMDSLGHRLNLLNPRHTHLGVGVAGADSGKLYSTQNFVNLRTAP